MKNIYINFEKLALKMLLKEAGLLIYKKVMSWHGKKWTNFFVGISQDGD